MNHPLHPAVRDYYERKLETHGATPSGVDWNSQASQELRFAELATLWDGHGDGSIVDYGCGYGALLPWLRAHAFTGPYVGFDLSPAMVRAGEQGATAGQLSAWRFTSDRASLATADYAVASGVFNVKMDTPVADWHAYVLATIDELALLGRRGFAFNALTSYADPERQRADLYYANPLDLFDHCKRRYSRAVALLHDYPLYEFTLVVRHL